MKRLLSIAATLAFVVAGAADTAKGHHKLTDRDAEITRTWCIEHQNNLPVGFRPEDRLAPEFEARLKVGAVLDAHLRGQIYPVPASLVRLLPPPPANMHYIAIGGHLAVLDGAHRLQGLLPIPSI